MLRIHLFTIKTLRARVVMPLNREDTYTCTLTINYGYFKIDFSLAL